MRHASTLCLILLLFSHRAFCSTPEVIDLSRIHHITFYGGHNKTQSHFGNPSVSQIQYIGGSAPDLHLSELTCYNKGYQTGPFNTINQQWECKVTGGQPLPENIKISSARVYCEGRDGSAYDIHNAYLDSCYVTYTADYINHPSARPIYPTLDDLPSAPPPPDAASFIPNIPLTPPEYIPPPPPPAVQLPPAPAFPNEVGMERDALSLPFYRVYDASGPQGDKTPPVLGYVYPRPFLEPGELLLDYVDAHQAWSGGLVARKLGDSDVELRLVTPAHGEQALYTLQRQPSGAYRLVTPGGIAYAESSASGRLLGGKTFQLTRLTDGRVLARMDPSWLGGHWRLTHVERDAIDPRIVALVSAVIRFRAEQKGAARVEL